MHSNCSKICVCANDELTCNEYSCSAYASCQVTERAYQCQCNKGFIGDGRDCVTAATDCLDLYNAGMITNGIYTIQPAGWPTPGFEVYCEMESNDGGWTVRLVVFNHRIAY